MRFKHIFNLLLLLLLLVDFNAFAGQLQPPSASEAGQDTVICGNNTLQLEASEPLPGESGLWTIEEGTAASFIDDTLFNTEFTGQVGQSYLLKWTITASDLSTSEDTVRIIFSNNPTTAKAADDKTGSETCGLTEININANSPGGSETGQWNIISGVGGNFTPQDSENTTFTGLPTELYEAEWIISNDYCVSRDTMQIRFNVNPTQANAGADSTGLETCGDTIISTNANTPLVSETGLWNILSGTGGYLDDSNIPQTLFHGNGGISYELEWTISNTYCTTRDTVFYTLNQLPDTADAGSDQTDASMCGLTSTSLNGNTPEIGIGTWTIISGNGGTIIDETNPGSTFTGMVDSTYVLRWTIRNAPCDSTYDETTVSFYTSPTPADAGSDKIGAQMCDSSSTVMDANTISIGNAFWEIAEGSGGYFDDISNPNAVFTGIADSSYTLVWTSTNAPCPASTDTVIVSFGKMPTLADAGDDQSVCSYSTTLEGNIPVTGSGQWSLHPTASGTFNNNTQYNTEITGLGLGNDTLFWETTYGFCTSTDTVVITNNLPTTPDAGLDKTICADTITLDANTPSIGTGSWQLISGAGNISDTTITNPHVTDLAQGENHFRWIIRNNGCSLSDVVIITNDLPNPANAGGDNTICSENYTLTADSALIGTGQWTSITGGVTFTDATAHNTEVTGLNFGDNILKWKVTNNACFYSDTVVINNDLIVADAGDNYTACADTFTMQANNPNPGTGSWETVSGGANFVDLTAHNTPITNISQGTNIFRWEVVHNACTSTDDIIITNNTPTTANAGNPQTLCVDTAILNGNTPVIGTGSWSFAIGGGGNIAQAGNPQSFVGNLQQGDNYLVWEINNGLCSSSDTVRITNDLPTPAFAGYDEVICTDSIQLHADTAIIGTGRWFQGSGFGNIDDQYWQDTWVHNIARGDNYFIWKTVNGICELKDTVKITNDMPSMPIAGNDRTLCNDSVTMQANNPTIGTGEWQLVSGSGLIGNTADNNTYVSNLGSGDNVLYWVISYNSCTLTDTVTITNDLPSTPDAGEDKLTCEDNTQLEGNNPTVGTGTWIRISGGGAAVSPNLYNSDVTGLNPGLNTYRWIIENNACSLYDDVVITYNELIADAGEDQTVCSDSAVLAGVLPTGVDGYWTVVGGSGTFNDSARYDATVIGLDFGENIFRWNISQGSCHANDEVTIINDLPSPAEADAGIDQTVCEAQANLAAQFPAIGTGTWTITGGSASIDDPDIFNTHVDNLGFGANTFRWTVTNNDCESWDEVDITYSAFLNEPDEDDAHAGAYQTVCDSSTTLDAQAPDNGTGEWSVIYGAGTVIDIDNPTSQVTGLGQNNNILRWTITSPDGCMKTADVTIKNSIPVDVYAGDDRAVCSDATNLAANSFSEQWDADAYTGEWSVVNGTGDITFLDPSSPSSYVYGLELGPNTLRWNVVRNGCQKSDTVIITNNLPTEPDAGDDMTTVCTDTIVMVGNTPDVGSGLWTIQQGAGSFIDATNPTTIYRNIGQGTNRLIWTITNDNCILKDTVIVYNHVPDIAFAGQDQVLCTDSTFLNADPADYGIGEWSVVNGQGNGIFENANNPQSKVTGLSQGSNLFVWTVVANGMCYSRDTVEITNNFPSDAGVQDNVNICADTVTVSATEPTIGSGNWSVVTGSGNFTDQNSNTSFVSGLTLGENKFRWVVTNEGCTDTAFVTVSRDYPGDANAGNPQEICGTSTNLNGNNPTAGTGTWSFANGEGSGTITSPNMPNSHVSNLAPGENKLVWTLSNGLCISKDTVSITNVFPEYVEAGINQNICDDSTQLNANTPAMGTGTWSIEDGGGFISNADMNNPNASIINIPQGTSRIRWTIEINGCTSYDDVLISNNLPSAPDAGTDMHLCGDTALLSADEPTIGTGEWSRLTGFGVFDNQDNASTTIRNLSFDENTLIWTVTNNGCSLIDTINLYNDFDETVSAGLDKNLCGDSILIVGQAHSSANINWTLHSGAGNIETPSNDSTFISGTSQGDNYFIITSTINSCSNKDTMIITNINPSNAFAGLNDDICDEEYTFNGQTPSIGTGEWTLENGTGIIAQSNNAQSAVSNLGFGNNTFVWTVTNQGCTKTDTVIITNNHIENLFAGNDVSLCTDSLILNADSNEVGNGRWKIISGSGVFADSSKFNTQISDIGYGTNLLTWTVTYNSCQSKDSVLITNNLPHEVNAGDNQIICGKSTTLTATPLTSGTGVWSFVSGGGSIAESSNPTTIVTGLNFGSNILKWTVNNTGCTIVDSVEIVNNMPENISAGLDQFVCADSAVFEADSAVYGTGTWNLISGNGVFVNDTSHISTVQDLNYGINSFEWLVSYNGCEARDTVNITNNIPYPVEAGTNQIICSDQSIMAATEPTVGTGSWSVLSGTGTFATNDFNTSISEISFGTNTYKWKVDNNGCSRFDTVRIKNNKYQAVNAGAHQNVCGDTVRLEAVYPGFGNGTWSIGQGSGVFADSSLATTIVTGIADGENEYIWTIEIDNCEASDTVSISNVNPSTALAGSNQSICGNFTQLEANTPILGTGEWLIEVGGGSFTEINNPETQVTNIPFGENTYVWKINLNGCISTDTVVIENNFVQDANAGLNNTVCGNIDTLEAVMPTQGVGKWSLISGSADIEDEFNPQSPVSNLDQGENVLRWTVTYDGCEAYDEVSIFNINPDYAEAGQIQNVCGDSTSLEGSVPAIGTGEWTIQTGGATIEDANSPNTPITELNFGQNIFKWTISYQGCTSSDTVVINNNYYEDVFAGNDTSICADFDTLNAGTPNYGTGSWNLISGAGNFDDNTSENAEISGLNQGENILLWSVTYNACTSRDTVVITNNLPSEADAGNLQSVCADTAQLNAQTPAIGTGTWTIISGTGTFTDLHNPQDIISGLSLGSNKFKWTINHEGCIDADSVEIINNMPSVPNAGANIYACGDSTSLDASTPIFGTGEWSIIQGSGTIDDITADSSVITNLIPGETILQWTLTNGVCSSSDNVSIFNEPIPEAGNDTAVCSGSASLSGSTPVYGTIEWTIGSMGSGNFSNNTSANTDVTGLAQGDNIIRMTVTNNTCLVYDEITVSNNEIAPEVNAGNDIYACEGIASVNATAPSSGTGTWTRISGSATILTPNNTTSSIEDLAPGTNTLRWTVTNGSCTASDDVQIFNEPKAFAGNDTSVCSPNGIFEATAPSVGDGEWSVLQGAGNILTNSNPQSAYYDLVTGTNSFIWTITNNSCTTSDTVTFNHNGPYPVDAGESQLVCADSALLNAVSPTVGTGNWSVINGAGNFTDVNNPNTIVSGLLPGNNKFRWTVTYNSCSASSDIVIKYQPEANAGDDETICSNETYIDANQVYFGTGQWSRIQGAGVFGNANYNYTQVTGVGTGENIYVWTINTPSCTTRDTVIITNNTPFPVDAGEDISVCIDSTFLNAVTPTVGTGQWTYINGSGIITDINDPQSAINNLGTTVNELRWVVTNENCVAEDTLFVSNDYPTEADAGIDTIICYSSYTLEGNNAGIGVGNWNFIQGSGNFNNSTIGNTEVTDLDYGENVLVWTISSGNCATDDTISITNNLPSPAIITTPEQAFCNENIALEAEEISIGTGTWSTVSGQSAFNPANNINTILTELPLDTNYIVWTTSYEECSLSDTIAIVNLFPFLANAGPDDTICSYQKILEATPLNYGTGIWSALGTPVTFTDQNLYNTQAQNITQGENRLVWTVNYQGCTNKDTVTIINDSPTQPNAGNNEIECGTETNLHANNPLIGTGEWSLISGAGVFDDDTNPNTGVTGLQNGDNVFAWTITNNECELTDYVTVTNSLPNPYAGADQNICENSTYLNADSVILGIGTWTQISGNGNISDNHAHNTEVINLSFGENRFLWSVSYNGCTATDEVSIFNNTPETVNAGSDQTVCGDSTTLTANTPTEGTGSWSIYSGSGSFNDNNNPTTVITGLSEGPNYLIWTITNNTCSLSDTVVISNNQPQNVFAGEDFIVCDDTVSLSGTQPQFGATGTWTIVGGSATFIDNHAFNTQVTGLAQGTNILKWTVSNGICSASDEVMLQNESTHANAGADQLVFSSSTTLTGNDPAGNNGTWSVSSGAGSFSDANSPSTQVSGLLQGANIFTWTVYNAFCENSDDVVITRSIYPTSVFETNTIEGCQPLAISFTNYSTNALAYLWEFGDGETSIEEEPTHVYTEPGNYSVKLKCLAPDSTYAVSDTLNITVYPIPEANFTIVPDTVYLPDQQLHCNDMSVDAIEYLWMFGDDSTSTEQHPTHQYSDTGYFDITLIVWSDNECSDSMLVRNAVLVKNPGTIIFPTGFKPSLDGPISPTVNASEEGWNARNDIFYPYATSIATYNLRIFNRWGELVFESEDVNEGWNGYVKDKPAAQGVYVWMVEGTYENGKRYIKSGDVTIIH